MQPERKHKGSGALGDCLSSWREKPPGLQAHRPSSFFCSNSSRAVILQDLGTCPLAAWSTFPHPIQLGSHALIEASLTIPAPCNLATLFPLLCSSYHHPRLSSLFLCLWSISLRRETLQACFPWCPATQDCAWYRINTCQRCDKANELTVDSKLGCCVVVRSACRGRAGWFERVKMGD